ncbi:MAG TPA: hypothetical protein VG841_08715 [Caulobacterales bacterium]|nr:hypothetical protein [Caulobacterales bacterium]
MSEKLLQQELRFARATKRKYFFETEADDARVRSIYIDKSAFGGKRPPENLIVTVEPRT